MANINDKITKTRDGLINPVVTRVTGPRSAGNLTLQVDSLIGWPEDTAVNFSTYRVDGDGKKQAGSQIDWKAIANVATSQLTNLKRVGGAVDDGNVLGDYVQAGPTASWSNDLAEALLVSHNTDGTLKNNIVTTAKIADSNVTTAKIANASVTTAKIDFTR